MNFVERCATKLQKAPEPRDSMGCGSENARALAQSYHNRVRCVVPAACVCHITFSDSVLIQSPQVRKQGQILETWLLGSDPVRTWLAGQFFQKEATGHADVTSLNLKFGRDQWVILSRFSLMSAALLLIPTQKWQVSAGEADRGRPHGPAGVQGSLSEGSS